MRASYTPGRRILMRSVTLLVLGLLTALPSMARQADHEDARYVGSRSVAVADGHVIEWRADRVLDSKYGVATRYDRVEHLRRTASGERYDPSAMTAAHASFPYDSMVRVTSVETGRRMVVRINDRLDAGSRSVIRLSDAAAERLGFDASGGEGGREVRVELLSSETVPAVVIGPQLEDRAPREDVEQDLRPKDAMVRVALTVSDETFTLQIGSFSTLDAARRLASGVEGAWVMQVMEDGGRVYRVYYGQYEKEQEARAAQDRLRKKGRDSFLRTIPS